MHRRTFLTTTAAALAGATLPRLAFAEDCVATSSATQGPYWRPDAPFTTDLTRQGGEVITVHGVVRSARTCKPIAGALLDVWQADHHGKYDLDYRGSEVFGRARIRSGSDGAFAFRTIRPAPYGSPGFMRPAHIHFVLSAEGHRSLTTQLYFEGDPYLDKDPLRSVHADLIGRVRNGRCAFDAFLAH
jgi:protocatechuate 3,4-dioxygenase beta subunit